MQRRVPIAVRDAHLSVRGCRKPSSWLLLPPEGELTQPIIYQFHFMRRTPKICCCFLPQGRRRSNMICGREDGMGVDALHDTWHGPALCQLSNWSDLSSSFPLLCIIRFVPNTDPTEYGASCTLHAGSELDECYRLSRLQ